MKAADPGREWVARAGLLLACGLLVASLPAPRAAPPDCEHPVERAASGGHTVEAGCAAAPGGRDVRGPARLLFGLALDANRADRRSLESLPGIGPSRANAIETERSRRPFSAVPDLLRVPGIGPVTLERIAPWLCVSGREAGSDASGEPVGCRSGRTAREERS